MIGSDFVEEILSNRYEFILYASFVFVPVKRFECRSECEYLGMRMAARAKVA